MKFVQNKYIILALLLLASPLTLVGQDNTTTKNNKPGIYDNLYEIYLQASKNRSNEECIHLSDSMRTLAVVQGDKRAIAMSWANPLSYYLSKDDEEAIYATIDNLKKASEEAELWSFYYHAITQQSVYLLRHKKVAEVLELAQRTMDKAYADNNENGIYSSHMLFVNCYTLLGLNDKAIEEAQKAIDAEYDLPDTNFGNGVLKLAEIYYRKRDFQPVLDVIAKYEDDVQINTTKVRLSEYKAICSYFLGRMDDFRRYCKECEERSKLYGESTQKGQTIALKGLQAIDEGQLDKAEEIFDKLGSPDKYYYSFQLSKKKGDTDGMEKQLKKLSEYFYTQHMNLYDADIRKYEIELDNKNMEAERALEVRKLYTRWGASIVFLILLYGLYLIFSIRRNNKRLKAANDALTDQKRQLEDNIIAIRKANSENEAKTSFLFNMSHDIRTPMNAIIGFRDMLEKYQDDPVKRADYLKKIGDSSKVLLSIINNVLEMSRIEKGAVELNEEPFNAGQFYDSLYGSFEDMMSQKGVEFVRQFNIRHTSLLGDATKLREIFNNILSNAYKYTKQGGKVIMNVKEVPHDENPDFVLLRTTITDTGIGMSDEFLPHLFEEFTREDNSTDNKIEGTGLGMPIVKRLVDIMHGTIKTDSQKGVGTTFIVTIPHRISETEPDAQKEQEINPELFVGKRILLAEDNDLNAEITVDILGEYGIVVDRAEDGVKAVEMVRNAPYDYYCMVLMDVQMPKMNGYDATKAIRALEDVEKSSIPVVAMTANAFDEDKKNALLAGMNCHLAKPIEIDELMKILARFVK